MNHQLSKYLKSIPKGCTQLGLNAIKTKNMNKV